ncbi:MAG: TonB-dependent receptor [Silvibacterium sp.]|nr:TonB-dependent receptor [Silvibacterium sp.]
MLLVSPRLFAQATATGNIQGTVTDSSQAVVSAAEVIATNDSTGATRTTTTNDSGVYRFEFLPAGNYTVKITARGFSSIEQKVELLVGQTASTNVTLKPGATNETVEITAAAPIIDLNKTSVSTEITPDQVQNLPMVGRDVANLAYLAPGVKAADSYDPTKNRYAILSVNGAGGRNVNVTVNGIDNKDNTVGGPVMQLPLEAVEEFKISTQRFSAENGRSEGAAINMITKSGTNNYHGSLFGYFRSTNLNTDQKNPTGTGGYVTSHPDYSRQQFGGSEGGFLKRDKLFQFFAWERERESQGLIEDPTSYAELVLAKQAGLAAQPAAVIPRPFYETRYNGRMDFTINSRNNAYLSYTSQANNSLNDQSDGTGDLTNGNFTNNHLQLVGLTLNTLFSNTLVNQFTTGFQYWNNLIASNISAPLVVFPNASFGTNTNVPQQSYQRKWQFKDDISKTIGTHTLKGGVDYIWNPIEGGFFEFSSTLEVDFFDNPSAILSNPAKYPQGFSTPGAVSGMTQANGDPYFNVATKQLGLYIQDDWKVNPRLSLNLGLRYDKDFNMIGGSNIKNSRTYQLLVELNSPITNPYVASIAHDDNLDFSPRVGFAYDVTGKGRHVVRGGFGMYYGNIFQNIPLFMEQQSNPTIFQTALSLSSPTDSVPGTGQTLAQWQYGVSPYPTIPPPSPNLAPGSVGRLMDPHYRNPITEEFNVGYTWAINNNAAFELEYTHVLGIHENKTINIDQKVPVNGICCTRPLDPAFAASGLTELASVRNEEAIGRSHYDGVNFVYRQRMTQRFTLDANYTLAWAYSYGAGGTSFRNYPRLSTNPFASYEWGPNPNDERSHVTIAGVGYLPWGMQVAPILQYGSARPYPLTNSSNTLNTGGGTANAVVVPKSNIRDYLAYSGDNAAAQACFYGLGEPATCTISKFDPLRGDPFVELDLRLSKNIHFGERYNVELFGQAFNLTNRANYGNNYNNNIASPDTFGHPKGFINPSSTIIPRSLWGEFGGRFTF